MLREPCQKHWAAAFDQAMEYMFVTATNRLQDIADASSNLLCCLALQRTFNATLVSAADLLT